MVGLDSAGKVSRGVGSIVWFVSEVIIADKSSPYWLMQKPGHREERKWHRACASLAFLTIPSNDDPDTSLGGKYIARISMVFIDSECRHHANYIPTQSILLRGNGDFTESVLSATDVVIGTGE